MKQLPDRKLPKREQLKRKARAYSLQTIGKLLMLFAALTVCMSVVGIVMTMVVFPVVYHAYHAADGTAMWSIFGRSMFAGLVAIVVGQVSETLMARGVEEARLADKPSLLSNALLAREILVRGSEEPPIVQSAVLLRAAKGVETPQEELLQSVEE